MILTADQLLHIAPFAGPRADKCVGAINRAATRFDINTPRRLAHYLGQIAHESAQFSASRENLNYSAEQLMKTWPRRFTTIEHARGFAHMPEQIANFVYANRGGNGDMASGDGWRYRGAGWIQTTFKDNHLAAANYFGVSSDIGAWLEYPDGAALSAALYWKSNGCNALADLDQIDAISDTINMGRLTPATGDAIGYADRVHFTNLAKQVLAC